MKRLISLLLAVLWVLPISAQELNGTWEISQSMEEERDGLVTTAVVTDELQLSPDGTFRESGQMKMDIGNGERSYSLTVVYSGGGSWKREGDILTIQYNPKLARAEVTESDLPAAVKLLFANAAARELKKGMSSRKAESCRILSLTDTQLELQDADGKNPEVETYRRKK